MSGNLDTSDPAGAISSRVIKIGGEVALDARAVGELFDALSDAQPGLRTVVVHGGGAQASSLARRLDHSPTIVAGRRVTSEIDLQTILWSICGEINTRLVAAACNRGLRGVGLSGADDNMVLARKRPPREIDGTLVDFGLVGDVRSVDATLIHSLLASGFTPIIGTLGVDDAGGLLNINADTVAARIAMELRAASLHLITPSGGVRKSAEDPTSTLDSCSRAEFESGVSEGWITGGMRVKLEVALDCLDSGVERVVISSVQGISDNSGTVVS